MTCDKEAFCPQEVMENFLVPETFLSIQNMINEMKCRMLIGSIFIAASIAAVALTTLCLIIKSIQKIVSAKRSISNSEALGLPETTRIENRRVLSAEEITSRHRRLFVDRQEFEARGECSRRDQEPDLGIRDASRRERGGRVFRSSIMRESLRREEERKPGNRNSLSLPAFKDTRRLKMSTLVFVLYSAFFNFINQPFVLHFSGNVILVKAISLIFTSFSPLVTILMEKDILSFIRETVSGGEVN